MEVKFSGKVGTGSGACIRTVGRSDIHNIFCCCISWMVILMWTGNNITRPFRVAGAAALALAVDKGLNWVQEQLNLESMVYAFALVVGAVAVSCLALLFFQDGETRFTLLMFDSFSHSLPYCLFLFQS